MTPMFERAKTFHALDRAVSVISQSATNETKKEEYKTKWKTHNFKIILTRVKFGLLSEKRLDFRILREIVQIHCNSLTNRIL
jgi:hypothetical protein